MSRLSTRSSLIAKALRVFGSLVLLLASFQTARVATAAAAEAEIIDLLSAGRIRTSATWCYRKPGPERCATTLHVKDGSLVLDGAGCGSFRVPVNGSNGRQSAKIDGNTITVSVTGKNGTGVNTYALSSDLTQCSHTVECPSGFQAKVFSCAVERNTPTPAVVQQAPPAKESAEIKPSSETKTSSEPKPSSEAKTASETKASLEKSEQGPAQGPSPSVPRVAPVAAQSYMAAARALKEQDPNYNSLLAAALIFRRAAAAFQAAGDNVGARAAIDEVQTVESFVKLADERGGNRENQNRCGVLRGNALACYDRATRLRPAASSTPNSSTPSPERGAFLDCVKAYCSAMQSASCPMPIFGKDNAGFCFTAATDDLDRLQENSPACAPGKHLVSVPGAGEPICQDDAAGSTKPQPGSRSTKAGR